MGHKAAIIGLIIAGAIWGISGFAAKFFIELGFSFIFILWLSNIFRFISVWLISDYKGIKHEVVTDIKELRMILLNGLFALFTPLFFLASLVYTTLSNAYFIAYTAPAWVLVGAVLLLGEKLTAKKVFGLALTILGLFFIANPESILSLDLGFVFSFIAALTYAGDIITSRELKDYPFHAVSIYANGFQAIVLTLVVPFSVAIPDFNIFGIELLAIVVIGLLRGVASDLYYYALEKIEASTASILSLSELVIASVLAFVFLREVPTAIEFLGYAIVLCGAVIILLRDSDIDNFEYLLHLKRKH